MTRKQRTRILLLGPPELRRELADEVEASHQVDITSPARVGLVLATARESARQSLFHLGEVLVTEAKVRVNGFAGMGLVKGHEAEAALDLAVIDAAWHAGLASASWIERLESAEREIEWALDREQLSLSRTRVEFETLDSAP